ncbi:hypothetical protein [Pararhodobacter sp. SW119]|uniref:hypothetical protein n=1 Tax=Pararhodobacter sp. SW119 TaxID=2780075 RepID=UPI001ADFBD46|nr:hypothetical protein [Pararhodobacter sp. SW119]
MKIVFGVEEQQGETTESIGVFLTPKTLAILHYIIGRSLAKLEEGSGLKLEIPEEKLRQIDAGFNSSPEEGGD